MLQHSEIKTIRFCLTGSQEVVSSILIRSTLKIKHLQGNL